MAGAEPRPGAQGAGRPPARARGLERCRGPAGPQSHRHRRPPGLPLTAACRSAFALLRGPCLWPGAAIKVLPDFSPFLFLLWVHQTDLGVKHITLLPDLLDSRGRWHTGRKGHGRGHPDPVVQALRSPRAGSESGERAVPSAGSRGGDRARAVPGHQGTVTL